MLRSFLACLLLPLAAACTAPQDGGESEDAVTAIIETSLGVITIELNADAAPVTVANFVSLTEAGAFDGAGFYRTVRADNDRPDARIDVIQGGAGFDGLAEATPIAHESTALSGLSHVRGAISMARDEPGTATSEFFIVITDSTNLDAGPGGRNPDDEGYAVFGHVTQGLDVAEQIWNSPTGNETAPEGYAQQWLAEPVRIDRVRIENINSPD